MKSNKFKTIAAIAAAFVLVFAIGVASAWALSDAIGQGTDEQGTDEQTAGEPGVGRSSEEPIFVFPVNENNQTYGSLADWNGGDPPDLISARATNGVRGYISSEQLFSIKPSLGWDLEDILAYWDNYYYNAALAFVDYIRVRIGVELDVADVKAALYDASHFIDDDGNSAVLGNPNIDWLERVNPAGRAAILALLPESFQVEKLAQGALDAAWAADDVLIPVYAEDGVTVIGEWLCM